MTTSTPTLSSASNTDALSKEEIETLCWLKSQLDAPTIASSSFAHTGNFTSALHATSTESNPWIIDSVASYHMTLSSLFYSYHLCSDNDKVKMADGSLSPISSGPVTPSMSLSFVLHVPYFATNILSIARITHYLNCRFIINSHYCFFPGPSYGEDDW